MNSHRKYNFRLNVMLLLLVMGLMVSMRIEGASAEEKQIVPPEIEKFIANVHLAYNQQDYEAIYKNFATSRFRTSDKYDDYLGRMAAINKRFGKIKKATLTFWFNDNYKFRDHEYGFYRMQYDIEFERGKGHERFVVMLEDGQQKLMMDGYAFFVSGVIYIAQGNLYNFDALEVGQPDMNPLLFNLSYRDSKTEYILKEGFWPDMQTAVDWEDRFIPNKKEEHYPNGQIKWQLNYQNGKRHGPVTVYFENGQIFAEMVFADDVLDQIYRSYYSNGFLSYEGSWDHGKPVGTAREYYPDGIIHYEWEFWNGDNDYIAREFYENGELKIEKRVQKGYAVPFEVLDKLGDIVVSPDR